MRAIFDVGHPAHIHLFRNTIANLMKCGWEVRVAARAKEIMLELLNAYGLKYSILKHYDGLLKKAVGMFLIDYEYLKIARHFRPDILISVGAPYSAHVSRFIGKPHIVFDDTPANRGTIYYLMDHLLVAPFTDIICTPNVFPRQFNPKKQLTYNGYHELAYLHPKYFAADPSVLKLAGLTEKDAFVILRFASWDAIHDVGERGYKSIEERIDFVNELEKHCRVLITSEIKIPELKKHEVSIPPEKIHSLLAYASMYIGEGATMASEAGVLGVPWIFLYTQRLPYLDDQEKNYELGITLDDPSIALELSINLLKRKSLKQEWSEKRKRLLNDKIDVTKFMTKLILEKSKLM